MPDEAKEIDEKQYAMYDRVSKYWREHDKEIQEAQTASNHILKMLYKSLDLNTMASCRTVTCRTAHDMQIEHERQHYLDISRDCIVAAICDLIEKDYWR